MALFVAMHHFTDLLEVGGVLTGQGGWPEWNHRPPTRANPGCCLALGTLGRSHPTVADPPRYFMLAHMEGPEREILHERGR